jgi:thioredoxin-related protein
MKKIILLKILVLMTLQIKAISFYTGDYNQALQKAKSENKLLLLYFTAKWCSPCQYMNKYIFTDEEIHNSVNRDFIALKLDVDKGNNKEIYFKYNSEKGVSIPKFIFINHKEEVIKRHDGSMKLNQFKKFINIPEWTKPIDKAVANSVVQERVNKNRVKPTLFNKFMYNISNSRWKPGIRLGMNFNNFNTDNINDYNDTKVGLNVSLFLDYTAKHFTFQPGVAFSSKGARSKDSDESIRLNYVEVPLRLSINTFRFKIAGGRQPFRLNIEPYAAYAINGKYKDDYEKSDIKFGSDGNTFNRYDYGLKVGATQQLGSFEASVGYDFGLNNVSNYSDVTINNRGFFFNLAIIFGK